MPDRGLVKDGLRPSGIDVIGSVPWGTHFCQFYQTEQDLVDILVPYFKAGLQNNEFCMWVTSEPLLVAEARDAISRALPDFADYECRGQIEIIPHTEWYLLGGTFDADRVLAGWVSKLQQALAKGCAGLRLTGNTFWLERNAWHGFTNYEATVNDVIGRYRMVALCTYSLDRCDGSAVIDVVKNHQFALIKQAGRWDIIESAIYKQAKDALRESEEKYRNLFNTMTEGFALHDIVLDATGKPVDYTFIEVNEAFEKLTGLSRQKVVGKRVTEVLPGIERYWIETYGRVALTGEPAHFDNYSAPLGRWYEIHAYSPRRGAFVTLFRDVTERRKAEEALRESQAEIATVLASVPVLTIVVDTERRVLKANEAAARFAGRPVVEMVGMRGGEALGCLHSLDDPAGCGAGPACQACKVRLNVLDTFETGNSHHQVEWSRPFLRNGQSEEVTFLLSTVPVATPKKQVLICIEDITKRKRAEQQREKLLAEVATVNRELQRKAVELEAANRELEAFAYSVSHDLRAPLRSLSGFSDALVEDYRDRLDEQGKQYLEWIKESSLTMSQLIDDLLKLSRVARDEMVWETVDLSEITRSELQKLREAEPHRGVQCVVAPGLACQGDARLLRVALGNLLGNAWKFTARVAAPRIEVGVTDKDGVPAYFVRDNGVGFDKAYADRLFRPFQRLHRASDYPGTGIGLATVKRIVERHGGHVWADGDAGKGATFYFRLR